MTSAYTVRAVRVVQGELRVPGDKSISHRALMIASVGEGDTLLENLSTAEDVQATTAVLRRLGVVIGIPNSAAQPETNPGQGSGSQVLVSGRGWAGLTQAKTILDCGNSGTTARTMMGVLAGRPFSATLDGDTSLRARPMRRVIEPISRMGAVLESTDERLPIRITGGRLRGIVHELPIASAQVKTCLLMAGLQAEGETVVVEPAQSRDHTERLLRHLGVPIHTEINRHTVRATDIQNDAAISIPGDLSSAAFLLVAAAIVPGSEVIVRDVGINPTRSGILDVLSEYGASVEVSEQREVCGEPRGTVRVRAGDRRALEIDAAEPGAVQLDELPLVAVLAAVADGESTITGASELRVKESDRIGSVVGGLRAVGINARPLPDGFVIRGGRISGGEVDSRGDHRIAMAFAVAGLVGEAATTIHGWECVGVSYPEFGLDLDRVGVR